MGKYPFVMGCNVIALEKNNRKYGMVCAWAQMIGYDKIMMLIGSQSDTGKILEIGDIVGVSALDKAQEKISNFIGSKHSTKVDKFKDISITCVNSAILIDNAKTQSVCIVKDILHLEGIEEDNLVILDIKEIKTDETKDFLIYG